MSLKIAEAIRLLKIPGTYFSGADWKHGWPHKFYLGNTSVYNEQLRNSSDEEINAWSSLTEKFFGVTFFRNEQGQVRYVCDYPDASGSGYQRAGRVGMNGDPARTDEWNYDFPGRPIN